MNNTWYKEFWVWFIFLLLFLSILFSISSVFIAVKNIDPLVSKQWYQDGIEINNFLNKDINANINNMSVSLLHDRNSNKVYLYLSTDSKNIYEILYLYIEHPMLSDLDNVIVFNKIFRNVYVSDVNNVFYGRRNLVLYPNGKNWRIISQTVFPLNDKFSFGYDTKNK